MLGQLELSTAGKASYCRIVFAFGSLAIVLRCLGRHLKAMVSALSYATCAESLGRPCGGRAGSPQVSMPAALRRQMTHGAAPCWCAHASVPLTSFMRQQSNIGIYHPLLCDSPPEALCAPVPSQLRAFHDLYCAEDSCHVVNYAVHNMSDIANSGKGRERRGKAGSEERQWHLQLQNVVASLKHCSTALLSPPAQAPQCGQLQAQEKDDSAVAALAAGGGDSTARGALLESWKAYKRGFQQGIALFNAKPKKGVAFLQARPPTDHTQLGAPIWASLPVLQASQ